MVHKVTREEMNNFSEIIHESHKVIIKLSGGHSDEVRSKGMLDAVSFKILNYWHNHTTPATVGAFIYKTIATEQIFFDGNKRTSHVIAKIVMATMGLHLNINYKKALPFVLSIAKNEKSQKEIEEWIINNSQNIDKKKKLNYIRYDILKDDITYGEEDDSEKN